MICTKCNKEKNDSEFYMDSKTSKPMNPCKSCRAEYAKARYVKGTVNTESSKRNRAEKREYLKQYKMEKGCCMCGFNTHASALVFHHRNPEDKSFYIGSLGPTRNWKTLRNEIGKCVVMCSNCHNMLHAGELTLQE